MSERIKSFDEFWAKFLQVTFHLENPDRWNSRQRKANWCKQHLTLNTDSKILDLGCGDGLIDICLSRMGMEVTAVDRNSSVLEHAKKEDDTKKVKFIVSDLRKLNFPKSSLNAILFLETSGLLTKNDDQILLNRIHQWLSPKGKIIVDCCEFAEVSNSWSKTFPQGEVSVSSTFDLATRIQRIDFNFRTSDGEIFGLFDPIQDSKPGISRYLYSKEELTSMLNSAEFDVKEVPHYYEKNYYSLVGIKRI